MKREFRSFMAVPILFVVVFYIASFLILRSLSPEKWIESFKFQILRHQDPAKLRIRDWALLFKAYEQRGQESRALEIVRDMAARPGITLEDRVWFTGHCGRVLRKHKKYQLEAELNDLLLKEASPVYHHLFRAVSCEAQGDKVCEKNELSQARAIAPSQDLGGFINSQLVLHKSEEKGP